MEIGLRFVMRDFSETPFAKSYPCSCRRDPKEKAMNLDNELQIHRPEPSGTGVKMQRVFGEIRLFFFECGSRLQACLHLILFRRSTRWKSRTRLTRPKRNWPIV